METLPEIASSVVRLMFWTVLPWSLGALGVATVMSHTQFGRALIAFLRNRSRETDLLETVLQDLAEVRQATLEIAERLDAAEHRFIQSRASVLPEVVQSLSHEDRPPTPH
jgi:hypothetical protein